MLKNVVSQASEKITFDRFHVAKRVGDAVNIVRQLEHHPSRAQGESPLTRSKYLWLRRSENLDADDESRLEHLCRCATKTVRACSPKELAITLCSYARGGWARRAWKHWCSKAMRSRLEPIKRVARMIKKHLEGIINAIVLSASNARI